MVKDKWSFNAQVGIRTVLQCKNRVFLAMALLLNTILINAQQTHPQQKTDFEPVITVVGEAVIYSKDEAFNKQIRNNKNLQLHSNVEISGNSNLKISAKKVEKKTKTVTSHKKKKESIVIVAKEEKEKKYQSHLPKKDIEIIISSKDVTTEFSSGSSSSQISFVPPNNDYSQSKLFTGSYLYQKRISTKFVNNINYYYKNRNFKQQISLHKFSVRPPPVLFL